MNTIISYVALVADYLGFKSLQNTFNAQATTKMNLLALNKLEKMEVPQAVETALSTSSIVSNLQSQIDTFIGKVGQTVSSITFPNVTLDPATPIDVNALIIGLAAAQGVTLESKSYLLSFAGTGEILFNGASTLIDNKGDSIIVAFDGTQVSAVTKHDTDAAGDPSVVGEIPAFIGNVNDGQSQYLLDAGGLPIQATDASGLPVFEADGTTPVYVLNPYYIIPN